MKTKLERMQHIKTHIERFRLTSNAQANIEKGVGNTSACLLALASNAVAEAMIAWFEKKDLEATRKWFYVSALLEYKRNLRGDQPVQPLPAALGLIKPLISNNEMLVKKHVDLYEKAFSEKLINDVNARDFLAYQFLLAIRGEWRELKTRATNAISVGPDCSLNKRYLIDNQFFLALSEGDQEMMQLSLGQLLTPSLIVQRHEDESGFTQDLISTPAVIYSKIAARHGYMIPIDSPYVPTEWMGNEELPEYDAFYSFLKN